MGHWERSTFAFVFTFMFAFHAEALTTQELTKALQAKFPGASIVSQKDCGLGKKKSKVVGLVVRLRSAEANPLSAMVAQEMAGVINFTPLSKKISMSNGMDNDFLADFWDSSKKTTTSNDIRCVVPGKDKDITPKANGEYKEGFKSKLKKFFGSYGKHLCFQASTAYNSWACFNFDAASQLQSSYVQMNAD